nr:phospho-sugar mutase [Alicyclobacillus ferrooxydans]
MSDDARTLYSYWVSQSDLPSDLAAELQSISGDDAAILDRFYRDLEFGTGGLRGVLGAGTNRMNIYTVRKATVGFGRYILEQAQRKNAALPKCVVGYDCRRMSREFAVEVGLVLAKLGITTYVFEHLCPTPELSFAVRQLQAQGGIMITASHNPPEYNGYKVYDENGCQVLPDDAARITALIEQTGSLFDIPVMALEEAEACGRFQWVGDAIDTAYTTRVVETIHLGELGATDRDRVKIVYTPLHGTGNLPVRSVLAQAGYKDVFVVPEQAEPDGEFSTVKSPNPEEAAALAMSVELAKSKGADIAMGTDPDADRVGIAARDQDGEYHLLSGNQVGGLLVDFVLQRRRATGKLPSDGIVLKTIVTSELGAASARKLGVQVEDTLTGFKYIGDRIAHYEQAGTGTFLFGYEESYGYLAEGFVRDKDAVQTCLLIAEMTAFYKQKGWTLLDALQDLYRRVGYFEERLISATLPGLEGVQKIRDLMTGLRKDGLNVAGMTLATVEDYESGTRTWTPDADGRETPTERLTLPQADVLKYIFTDGSWLAARPSGTEPKIKFYVGAKGLSQENCFDAVTRLCAAVEDILQAVR